MSDKTQQSVKTLIDHAAERVGSVSALSRMLDVATSTVLDWKAGRQNPSPGDRARIAAFAGEDAMQELVRATLENAKGETRRKQLEQVLGKLSRATGVVAVIASLVVASLTFGSRSNEAQVAFS